MDNDPTQASQAQVANHRDGLSNLPADKVLTVVFYGAVAIWAVSVVTTTWSVLSQSGQYSMQDASVSTRLLNLITAVGSTWGYLLVAVIALSAKELLRARD